MSQLKVLSVASEIYPLIKTGGLADVTGALPLALANEGADMRTLVPGYPSVIGALQQAQEITAFPGLFGTARLLAGKAHGLNLFVLDAPYLYGRPGNPYIGPDGTDWPDNAYRFGALAKVAAEIGLGLLSAFTPDVVHMHDWQTGLTAAYMHYSGKSAPGTVMTVHNLAFPGQFPAELVMPLGLPPAAFAWDGVEHYGQIGFLKAGLQLADRITTVSPSYALEILQPEAGMGFDGLLRSRVARVSGILNGIDIAVWDPANDPLIEKTYDAANLDARAVNKPVLQNMFGLSQDPDSLLVGVVSRLSWQKGLDVLLEALPALVGEGMQLAIVGSGEMELESKFLAAAEIYPGRVGVSIGHDETRAHRIQAGVDALVVPSLFEPCGLTQLAALRYGAVPVVARVGGLLDTIIDANEMALAKGVATGVQFSPVTSGNLAAALCRTSRLFRDRTTWRTMQRNGMGTDVSWRWPAHRYASLYRELCASSSRAGTTGGVVDKARGMEPAPYGSDRLKVVAFRPAGYESVTGKVAVTEPASAGKSNKLAADIGPAGGEDIKGKVAGTEHVSMSSDSRYPATGPETGSEPAVSGSGKGYATSVEPIVAETGHGVLSLAGKDSIEPGRSKVTGADAAYGWPIAPASPEAGKHGDASIELAGSGSGEGKAVSVEPIGAGSGVLSLAGAAVTEAGGDIGETGASEGEHGYIVSAAWRDV